VWRVIECAEKETTEYKGRIIFLCASTSNPALDVDSATPEFPNALKRQRRAWHNLNGSYMGSGAGA